MLQHLFLHFSGFEGFTDFRCFHICRRNVTYQGITKEVGIVECKPDAASGNWGDTTGIPGTPFLKSWHLWCNLPFSNNIVPIMIWISGTFLPLMKDPTKSLTMRTGGKGLWATYKTMLSQHCLMILLKNFMLDLMLLQKESGELDQLKRLITFSNFFESWLICTRRNVPSSSPGAFQYTKIPQRKQTRQHSTKFLMWITQHFFVETIPIWKVEISIPLSG